jgi:hypothetical protein
LQPAPAAEPRVFRGHGVTVELNLGVAMVSAAVDNGMGLDGQTALGGLNAGIGGWISPDVALTARVAGATFTTDDNVQVTSGFFGPSLQLWLGDSGWIGGGVGLAFVTANVNGPDQATADRGFGLDLRAGAVLNRHSPHSLNLSVEYNPGFFHEDTLSGGIDIRVDTFAFLFGYQYL